MSKTTKEAWNHARVAWPKSASFCHFFVLSLQCSMLDVRGRQGIDTYISIKLPNTGFFNSKPKKDRFWGFVWKKKHRSGFCRSEHFGRSGVEKSVRKALNMR